MEPRTPPPRHAWLLPNLAVFFALFTILYALVFYRAPQQLFRDSDTGWHIRTGERILARAEVPTQDEYSFSKPGQQWFAWEWLPDVLMGAAHQRLGLAGVALLYTLAIGACSYLWVRLHWATGGNMLLLFLFAAPFLSTAQLHWLARPHVLSWLLILTALLLVERGRMKPWHALLLAAVWANVHGSFFFLPLFCVIYRQNSVTILAAIAGSFVNPYGFQLHLHTFQYLADTELLSRIAEFQSFNFHTPGAWQVAAVLLLGMFGFTCATATGQWSRAAVLLLLTAMAVRSARGLPILALAGLPLANGAITAAFAQWPLFPIRARQALQYGQRLKRLDLPLQGYLPAAVLTVLAALAIIGSQPGFPKTEFPIASAGLLPENARVLAPDKFGGYLIYRFNGRLKVYFDGRSDYYGAAFLKDYISLLELRPGWEQILAKQNFTHALLPPNYSLVAALEKSGWRRTFADETSVLLQRNF